MNFKAIDQNEVSVLEMTVRGNRRINKTNKYIIEQHTNTHVYTNMHMQNRWEDNKQGRLSACT